MSHSRGPRIAAAERICYKTKKKGEISRQSITLNRRVTSRAEGRAKYVYFVFLRIKTEAKIFSFSGGGGWGGKVESNLACIKK